MRLSRSSGVSWRQRSAVRVRSMRASDVAQVSTAFRDAFNEIYTRRGYGPVVADEGVGVVIADTYRSLDPDHCLVLERDGRVVGSGFLHVRGATAGVGPITVAPGNQGSGAGHQLMREICRLADDAGVRSLRLIQDAFNETAFALYGAVGFVAREIFARASFPSTRRSPRSSCRRAVAADIDRIIELEADLLGIRRRRDQELLLRVGETFVGERREETHSYLARIVRGRVAVLGPAVAPTLEEMLELIAHATQDLPAGTDTRLLVPARCHDLLAALSERRLIMHSLCLYMVRGEYEPFRGYYVPTLFPESG